MVTTDSQSMEHTPTTVKMNLKHVAVSSRVESSLLVSWPLATIELDALTRTFSESFPNEPKEVDD